MLRQIALFLPFRLDKAFCGCALARRSAVQIATETKLVLTAHPERVKRP